MVNKSQLDTENYKYPAYVLSNGPDKTYEKEKFNIHMFDVNGEYKIETKSNIELRKVK